MKGRTTFRLSRLQPLSIFKENTNRKMIERSNPMKILLGLIDALPVVLEGKEEIDQFLEQAVAQHNLHPASGPNANRPYDAARLRKAIGDMYRNQKLDAVANEDISNHSMIFQNGSSVLKPKYLESIGYTKSAGQNAQSLEAEEEEAIVDVSAIAEPSSPQVAGSTKHSVLTDNGDDIEAPPKKKAKVSIEPTTTQGSASVPQRVREERPQPLRNHLALFENTFLGDDEIKSQVSALQFESLNAMAVFLEDIGAAGTSDVQIVTTPSQSLAALYTMMFNERDYRAAAAAVIAADTTKTMTFLRSLIAAYLVNNIFRKKLPWSAVHHILSTSGGEWLARVISRQSLPGTEVIRQASVEHIRDDDFQKETVEPAAGSMAKDMMLTLLPHLKLYRQSSVFAQACADLVPRLGELCRHAFILHALMDATPHEFSVLWPVKEPFDRTTMVQQNGSFRDGEVEMVVFPGFHCTPTDLTLWPESTSARALVHVTTKPKESTAL